MTDAEKREKVIRGLEQFIDDFKPFCGNRADWQKVYDALALLKGQEARVMTFEEIQERAETVDPDPVFVEGKSGATYWALYTIDYMAKRPNRVIRVWTARPTPKQMRDTPWEEPDV